MTGADEAMYGAAAGGLWLGIDLGGTKIAGGLVDPSTGQVSFRREEPTRAEDGGASVLARVEVMAAALADAAGRGEVRGLGLGLPELVDRDGTIFSGFRIDWRGLPAAARLSGAHPVRFEADVRAAALAEARLGAGAPFRDFLYVTIGTGISAVSVQNGRPYPGARGAALVMANGISRQLCDACGEESRYVLEDVASGPGLVAGLIAHGGRAARAEDVLAAAAGGDLIARHVIDAAALRLGQAIALLAGVLDPEAIVLGGGLGSAAGPYHDALAREIRAGLWQDDPRPLPILRAALGADAGLIGAALAARDHFTTTTTEPDNRPLHPNSELRETSP